MSALLALLLTASAQEAEGVNAQLYTPPIDSQRTLWVEDSAFLPSRTATARGVFSYTNRPLIYVKDGDTTVVVRDVLQLDAAMGVTFGRVRLGVNIPVYLASSGLDAGGLGIGDARLDGKVGILDREDAPIGLALSGRADLPTGSVALPLSSGKPAGEFTAIVDRPFGDLLLAADIGVRFRPKAELENVTLDDALIYRVGAAYAFADNAGGSLEFAGNSGFGTTGTGAGSPLEALLGGFYRLDNGLTFRGGAGTGITRGIGSPVARAIFMLGYEPQPAKDLDLDGIVDDEDSCPQDPEDVDTYEDTDGCPDPDNDGDGLLDTADACPMEPEDMDEWVDEDGCPEPEIKVRFAIVDPEGNEVAGARYVLPDGEAFDAPAEAGWLPGIYELTADAEDYDGITTEITVALPGPQIVKTVLKPTATMGTLTVFVVDGDGNPIEGALYSLSDKPGEYDAGGVLSLKPGTVKVVAKAEGYRDTIGTGEIVAGEQTDVRIELDKVVGELLVKVVGPDGNPVEGATFTVGDEGDEQAVGELLTLPPGEVSVTARAPSYAPGKGTITVVTGETAELTVTLAASKIKVTKTQITLEEKVYFRTGRADIQPQSFAMLDEVAQLIADHPELKKLKIEGHTDSRGSDASNMALSERRAASVRTYLIEQGVAPERLVSEGYGETKPLDPAETPEAWEKNRRVDIFILEREE